MSVSADVSEISRDLPLSPNALVVLKRRYLKKDAKGEVAEAAPDMFRRVADTIAAMDKNYDPAADVAATARKFYEMMSSLAFMPNSPTLMNAGRELGQLSACFVLPVEDSIDSIFDAIKNTALIHKSGGGTGFSFSRIRPENDPVMSTKGVASGPISFMNIFDVATETIKQGGTRRGANMGLLRVDHPDIEKFITCKSDTKKLTNFNISVGLTDAFMEAVREDKPFALLNPTLQKGGGPGPGRRALRPHRPERLGHRRARHHFPGRHQPRQPPVPPGRARGHQPLRRAAPAALRVLQPGVAEPGPHGGGRQRQLQGPQGAGAQRRPLPGQRHRRQPLPPGPHRRQHQEQPQGGPGRHGLCGSAPAARHPLQLRGSHRRGRRGHGLHQPGGPGGLGRAGRPPGELPHLPRQPLQHHNGNGNGHGRMRNATVTTIAPTGTISIIAGASSGIEPLFAISYVRRVLEGTELIEVHPYFEELARRRGFYSPELMRAVAQTGSIREFKEIPKDIRRLFVTAHEVTPSWHIRIQSAFQKHTDNAVSKTVNFPRQATPEDVRRVYLMAYAEGLKGVTIYRDGSREDQVLSFGEQKKPKEFEYIVPRPRPEETNGVTRLISTGCGKLYVTVNSDEDGFCEVFAQMGKTGGCACSQIESTGRLISLALRSGVHIEAIVKQINGIRCPHSMWQNGRQVLSCPDAIAQVLSQVSETKLPTPSAAMGACPDCGGAIEPEGGCLVCRACGFSKCN